MGISRTWLDRFALVALPLACGGAHLFACIEAKGQTVVVPAATSAEFQPPAPDPPPASAIALDAASTNGSPILWVRAKNQAGDTQAQSNAIMQADQPPAVNPELDTLLAAPVSTDNGAVANPPGSGPRLKDIAASHGPSPFRPDVQMLPIDLPTALRLTNASNPTIGVAQARLREAYAHLRQAEVMWLPNLQAGPSYMRHDGELQTSRGDLISVSKWNFFIGGGSALTLETSDALFGPLIARRLVDAQAAATRTVTDNIQLDVAVAYLDLVRAYGALAINAETLANAEEILRLAEAAERNGFGKTPADAVRGRTEVSLRRQERIRLGGQAAVASARLTQLLLLDPTAQLQPAERAIVPIAIVPSESPLIDLVGTAMMNRPELAEGRSLVAASVARWRQSRVAPLLPRLEATYFAGDFGGGINDNTQTFRGRGDGSAQAVWTLHNFGAGDVARVQVSRAQYDQASLHVMEVQAQVAADVTSAANLVLSRQRTLDDARKGVQQGEELWRRLKKWTIEVGFRANQYEAVELLLAEQALNQARNEYLLEVIEFSQEQFRLYWAMGQPPLEALPKATPLVVGAPVLPPGSNLLETLPAPRPVNAGAK